MLPKVQAAVNFAQSGKGHIAVIASLAKAAEAIEGKSGTRITMEKEENDRFYVPTEDPREQVWLYR